MTTDRIDKSTTLKRAKEIIQAHKMTLPFNYTVVLSNLLKDCDYLTVEGEGINARLIPHSE